MSERILCVDDDEKILRGYARQMGEQFALDTAPGPQEALSTLREKGPYAVVLTDMRMPGMNGIQLLAHVRKESPDTVRMILTGYSDLQTTIDAVNEGNVFRFLTKPCPPEMLVKAIGAAVEQYHLVRAEKELLEKTLSGSVKVLTEVLSLVNPLAFGRASRVQRLVQQISSKLQAEQNWQVDVAAMLSQLGCVAVPEETLAKVYRGHDLSDDEQQTFRRHIEIGQGLIAQIPRLQEVAETIGYQEKCFDGGGSPENGHQGKQIPLGARLLKVALDFDTHESNGLKPAEVLQRLKKQKTWYDPDILAALEAVLQTTWAVRSVSLGELADKMILAADVMTMDGKLLVGKGQEVTPSLRQRLDNFARNTKIRAPILVQMNCS